jgi:acetyl esterase
MPLHPMIQAMLDKAAGLPAMHTVPVDKIRAGNMARYAAVPRPDVAHVQDRMIEGPRGPVMVRIYRPDLTDGRPVIVFFHGSGFVICSVDTHDGFCRQMCLQTGMIVVSVDPNTSSPPDRMTALPRRSGWPPTRQASAATPRGSPLPGTARAAPWPP